MPHYIQHDILTELSDQESSLHKHKAYPCVAHICSKIPLATISRIPTIIWKTGTKSWSSILENKNFPAWFFHGWYSSSSIQAATTKYHRSSGLWEQTLTSHSSGGSSPRSGCQHGHILVRTLFHTADYCLLTFSHGSEGKKQENSLASANKYINSIHKCPTLIA